MLVEVGDQVEVLLVLDVFAFVLAILLDDAFLYRWRQRTELNLLITPVRGLLANDKVLLA